MVITVVRWLVLWYLEPLHGTAVLGTAVIVSSHVPCNKVDDDGCHEERSHTRHHTVNRDEQQRGFSLEVHVTCERYIETALPTS